MVIKLISGGSDAKGHFIDERNKKVKPLSERGNTKTTSTSPLKENLPAPQSQSSSVAELPTPNDGVAEETSPDKGFKNVGAVLKQAINPFDEERITANVENQTLKKILEFGANHPFITAGLGATLYYAAVNVLAPTAAVNGGDAATASLNIGKVGVVETPSTAASVATNTATTRTTTTWFSRLLSETKTVTTTNPATGSTGVKVITTTGGKIIPATAITGGLLAIIGSYPFAGFIKEESLQTLSFASNAAIKNGDYDGAKEAFELQEEILDPNLWNQIIAGVPFANVIDNLRDFYEAARIKLSVDQQVVNDLQVADEKGVTDEDYYREQEEQRKADKEAERAADEAYYAEIEKRRQDAKAKERAADEAYWNNILKNREQDTAKKEEFDEDYWSLYYKELQKYRDANTPSNLKFGLL